MISVISFNLNFIWSAKFVLWIPFIFEITQKITVIFFKVMRRKHARKVIQSFACKHKINESYAKVPTHYWIVWFHSKNVSFYVFIPDKFFNLFRNLFNNKTIKINNFTFSTKSINPVCTNICIFIKIYDIRPILYVF